jgi:choline dehydrogenase-like flavoprotein
VLGWRATAATINARGCLRTGYCGQGCRYDAKQGAHLTYVPRALRAGARLFTHARAGRVTLVERGSRRARKRVVATVGAPSSDRQCQLTIDAPTVVVAAGAIETPALLQRSGLGGGGVGRFLRLHPTTAVIGIYDRPIYAAAGIPLSAVCDEFSRSDANGYGFWIECPPLHPALAAVAAPSFGESHASVMRQFANMGALIALVRDGADRERSTGSVMVDRRGRTRINYRIGPRDAAHLSAAIAAATRLHFSNGSSEVRSLHTRATVFRNEADLAGLPSASHAPNDVGLFSAHVTGTCRIGTDSRTSGVTPNFERHGAPGVFVCDGSLLPTAPGVNPQETIMAMAMIVASRVHASASA